MGGALARGFAKAGLCPAEHITLAAPHESTLGRFAEAGFATTTDNKAAAAGADVVIVAVKPWLVGGVIDEIRPALDYGRQTLVSVAAGVSGDELKAMLSADGGTMPATFIAIPNTAVAVGEGMTFITSLCSTPEMDAQILDIFKEMGDAMLVDERLVGAGMALSSCGIAYVMRYIRAATEGGVELGFYAADAQRVMMQTMKGAVALLSEGGLHPEAEIDKVTTPGGLTIRGLNAMEESGFSAAVVRGLRACCSR